MNKINVILLRASPIFVLALFVFCNALGQSSDPERVFSLAYDEQQPILAPDGTLFFTLAFHPDNKGGENDPGDVWFSQEIGGRFVSPQAIPELSTRHYDLLIGFIGQDSALVYHANLNNQQVIQRYFWDGMGWDKQVVMNIPGFKTKGDNFSAVLDPSGSYMVLSMNSYGSYGNEDIYVARRNGNSWSRPLNIGASINTSRQELSPDISSNGDTLYFATNAYGSQKSIEVYFSKRLDDTWRNWSSPELLKLSELTGIDMYYRRDPNSDRFFFTNTQSSDGFGNIYYNGDVALQVIPPSIESPDSLLTIPSASSHEKLKSPPKKNSQISPVYDSELTVENQVDRTIGSDFTKDLDSLAIGEGLILEGILFQRGSVALVNQESVEILDELANFMKANPEKIISIEGHTDSYGNANVNERLSLARANKIKEFLLKRGVTEGSMLTKGWGGKKPVATNSSEAGREKNRRVEIIVSAKK